MIYIDVDTAVTVPVNIMPLTDDSDFKTRETGVAYNQAGMDLVWNFVTPSGTITQTAVTPTTSGVHDWTHVGDGMYKIEIPATGGTVNNDTEGVGYFTGICTGVLAWRSPDICFRPAVLNDALLEGGDKLEVDVKQWNGTNVPSPDTAGYPKVTVKSGTGTGEINLSSGNARADLRQILGTNLSESTTARIADNWRQFYDNSDMSSSAIVGNIDATTSSRSTSDATAANQTTMLSRLTVTRAGFLDFLNIGGNVASQADVQGITQSQKCRITFPPQFERPESSSTAYRVHIITVNEQNEPEDMDSIPTVTAENNAATDRSSNLGTVTKVSATTGQYYVDYTVASSHAIEGIMFKVSVTENSNTTVYVAGTSVVDTTAIDFTAADRTKLEAIHSKLPSKDYIAGTANSDGDVELDDATGDFPGSVGSVAGNVDGTINGFTAAAKAVINAEADTALSDYDGPTKAELDAAFAEIKGAGFSATDTLEAIRNRGDAEWVTATGFNTTTPPTAAAITTAVLTTQMTEDYAALNTAPTLAQAMFEIRAELVEVSTSGTTKTTKKIDGSTTATTSTLNDATNPTSTTRAT